MSKLSWKSDVAWDPAAGGTYTIEVRHDGLHEYRLISGKSRQSVDEKAKYQCRKWDDTWKKREKAEREREQREHKAELAKRHKEKAAEEKQSKFTIAEQRTKAAVAELNALESVLHNSLDIQHVIDWDSLLNRSLFPDRLPPRPVMRDLPPEPCSTDLEFVPKEQWWYRFLPRLRVRAREQFQERFRGVHERWEKIVIDLVTEDKASAVAYATLEKEFHRRKQALELEQKEINDGITGKKTAYFLLVPEAITEYCNMVFARSQYPTGFAREWNLYYQPETKTLVVEYFLPSIEDVPTIREVKYVPSRDDFAVSSLPEATRNKTYDNLLYQITLRSIHELYDADQAAALDSIVFNGWVRSIDKGTGKPIKVCLLSVQASRQEFLEIDLRHVEPKTCFKTLKGIGSAQLHGLSPIAPILQLNKQDKRFVSSYSVAGDIDHSTNLAAMDWEDFEHLIRELFGKEFSQEGAEVKITQASRDGGVDAVAFDPDPIRGGKIVIQAKRYTNVVGVSAVRDLYGTVLSEGATKGILVTTAEYGPDAYAFAKGKPLTLLNGSNLLHLLEKHGHRAFIDLKAAKQVLADQRKAEQR